MTSDRSKRQPQSNAHRTDPLSDLAESQAILEHLSKNHPDGRADEERKRNAALEQSAQRWSTQQAFQAFRGVACSITANLDMRSLVKQILKAAIQTLGAERGILFLGREKDVGLLPVVAISITGQELDDLERVSRTILRQGSRGEVVVSQDAANDPRFRDVPSIKLKKIRSVMCAPLISRGKPIGLIHLDAPLAAGAFSEDGQRFLEAFADLAAVALENARLHGEVVHENTDLRRHLTSQESFKQLVTVSPRMNALLQRATLAAQVDAPIMILGESGTGKELLARSIHKTGPRALNPFVACNCAAVPRDLMESLFFGHTKGAFTGALRDTQGLLREADRGVLFLDEVTDLGPDLQGKLLRVIEDGVVRPLGTRRDIRVDVRVITATSRDIHTEIQEGRFREELYYRINVLELRIPPLRERPEDIPVLVDHFLHKHAEDRGDGRSVTFTGKAVQFLQTLPWRGNVREFESLVRRVLVLSNQPKVTVAQLKRFLSVPPGGGLAGIDKELGASTAAVGKGDGIRSMVELERDAIRTALIRTGGNKSRAARLLGLHRNTLLRRMKRLQVSWQI
ncbi:MAG: sigma-54-dependent Fis family transcriptional regulator [Candidatus Eisenbacteria sp.]|nr:sigma-54-dependent Fis family transcriptional regulator [Candidatus Eisenbacteria bacterium]